VVTEAEVELEMLHSSSNGYYYLYVCCCVVTEAEVELEMLHSSSNGNYTVFIVPDDCNIVDRGSAVVGTLRSAFVSYSQGSVYTCFQDCEEEIFAIS